jgi:hypothetical protein
MDAIFGQHKSLICEYLTIKDISILSSVSRELIDVKKFLCYVRTLVCYKAFNHIERDIPYMLYKQNTALPQRYLHFRGKDGKFVNEAGNQDSLSMQLTYGLQKICPNVFHGLFKEHLSDNLWANRHDQYTHKGEIFILLFDEHMVKMIADKKCDTVSNGNPEEKE